MITSTVQFSVTNKCLSLETGRCHHLSFFHIFFKCLKTRTNTFLGSISCFWIFLFASHIHYGIAILYKIKPDALLGTKSLHTCLTVKNMKTSIPPGIEKPLVPLLKMWKSQSQKWKTDSLSLGDCTGLQKVMHDWRSLGGQWSFSVWTHHCLTCKSSCLYKPTEDQFLHISRAVVTDALFPSHTVIWSLFFLSYHSLFLPLFLISL